MSDTRKRDPPETAPFQMGGSSSKSPFDRRNSVERRTQRRVLFNIKAKLQKLEKDTKKFNGLPGDEEYERLTNGISTIQKELAKKHPTLQPKIKASSVELQKEAEKLLETLVEKAKANEQKQHNNNKEEQQPQTPRTSSEIKQTVELRLVKVEPEEERPTSTSSSVRSPEETRRSILKVGVPVMPNVAKELKRKVEQSEKLEENPEESYLKFVEAIKREVEDIELKISEFVGLKGGAHYAQIQEKLFDDLSKLKEVPNQSEVVVEQKDLCVQYIRSCLNFLDEKAENEVFSSDNEEYTPQTQPPKGFKATLI